MKFEEIEGGDHFLGNYIDEEEEEKSQKKRRVGGENYCGFYRISYLYDSHEEYIKGVSKFLEIEKEDLSLSAQILYEIGSKQHFILSTNQEIEEEYNKLNETLNVASLNMKFERIKNSLKPHKEEEEFRDLILDNKKKNENCFKNAPDTN